jgi:sulfur-oxidizing protein SoxY
MPVTRRETLALGAAAAVALAARPALARAEVDALLKEFTGGRPTRGDGLSLDVPLTADNPNAVPVAVKLAERFSDSLWCEEILIIADRNPRPTVCRFRFERRMGLADVAIRVRLAESQSVIALARMSDGSVLMQSKPVTVAGGGCGM